MVLLDLLGTQIKIMLGQDLGRRLGNELIVVGAKKQVLGRLDIIC